MRRALFGSACESVLAGGLWDAGGQIPAEGTQSNNHIKPKEYVAGIRPILLVEIHGEYATTTKTEPTTYSLRLTCPAELKQ